jgi:hypothetical protein
MDISQELRLGLWLRAIDYFSCADISSICENVEIHKKRSLVRFYPNRLLYMARYDIHESGTDKSKSCSRVCSIVFLA